MSGREDNMGAQGEPGTRRAGRSARLSPSLLTDGREGDERDLDEREKTQERDLSDEDRLALFRDAQHQSVLPDLPHVPGHHVCWLTTSNPRDSIQHRLRLGYRLLRVEQFPEWDGVSTKVPNYDGVIGINEMVAASIPQHLYLRYMQHAHHDLPMSEEDKLKAAVERAQDELEAAGSKIAEIGDGTAGLAKRARPKFDGSLEHPE